MALRIVLALFTLVLAITMLGLLIVRMRPILRAMASARQVVRWDQPLYRIRSTAAQVFGHKRLLRQRLSGILHLFIFSGFVVLLLDIIETIGQLVYPEFSIGPVLGFLVDCFVLLVLAGVVLALYQRKVLHPKRFEGSDEKDGELILGMITLIVVGIAIHNSFFRLLEHPVFGMTTSADGHFLSYLLDPLWVRLGWGTPIAASIGYSVGYALDIGTILWFLAYLPTSKHLHVFFGAPAVFFRKLGTPGRFLPTPTEVHSSGDSGISATRDMTVQPIQSFADMTWRDVLDLFTCTECGRCQDVCPAHQAGQPLSPKMLILDLRDALVQQTRGVESSVVRSLSLAGDVISAETLWSCTTCGACQEACPVFIEHVPKIVGLRAALVERGEVEERPQEVLEHWGEERNAYGKMPETRPAWRNRVTYHFKDLRRESAEWLWFVGDVASFDNDLGVARSVDAIATLLGGAGLDVGLLYDWEGSSGNDVLRMGEYGLFEQLATENMRAMERAQFERVLTSDPHSFNALRNDYPQLGFKKPIYHYSQVLQQLMTEGKVAPTHSLGIRATFHDPCYLGRWNQVFEAPRDILRRCGVDIVEMPRSFANSFCCGAGGGRMWMNEAGMKERPSEARIREALELPGVTHFVVSCPKDMVMYSAAVTALGCQDRLSVVDVGELVLESTGWQLARTSAS
ncbi:MAG: (Fe-S)-binding protein [Alicyclobacillaceae bacterium]|nr:(Fe-S)-binding protein [Alicyclobacillaceae bacterium]